MSAQWKYHKSSAAAPSGVRNWFQLIIEGVEMDLKKKAKTETLCKNQGLEVRDYWKGWMAVHFL